MLTLTLGAEDSVNGTRGSCRICLSLGGGHQKPRCHVACSANALRNAFEQLTPPLLASSYSDSLRWCWIIWHLTLLYIIYCHMRILVASCYYPRWPPPNSDLMLMSHSHMIMCSMSWFGTCRDTMDKRKRTHSSNSGQAKPMPCPHSNVVESK